MSLKKIYKRSNAMKRLDKNEAEIKQLFALKSGKQFVCRKYRVSINTLVKWLNEAKV